MAYFVKEVFYTLQGEGANAGRPAVFCRFSRCNLWSGRETDRPYAICKFCDTNFLRMDGAGGGIFDSESSLVDAIEKEWTFDYRGRFVVLTGGEPLIQVDEPLIAELHKRDFEIAVETNGTIQAPKGLDWICVSPKAGAKFVQKTGNEIKLVFPQTGISPEDVDSLLFTHFFLQPMDGPEAEWNTKKAIQYCLGHPKWRLSLQTHKILGLR